VGRLTHRGGQKKHLSRVWGDWRMASDDSSDGLGARAARIQLNK
jgi:hypothetical protein